MEPGRERVHHAGVDPTGEHVDCPVVAEVDRREPEADRDHGDEEDEHPPSRQEVPISDHVDEPVGGHRSMQAGKTILHFENSII